MNITGIKEQLKEARRLRDNTSVKINDYKKKGKDTTDLEKQLQGLRDRVAELTALEKLTKENIKNAANGTKHPIQKVEIPESAWIPKGEQKQLCEQANKETKRVKKVAKSWTKAQLESCEHTLRLLLEANDWCNGYQFRSSEWMYLTFLRTRVLPDSVELQYTIQYKTKNHRVERTVSKYFNPETINTVQKYIDDVELWVMLNSGDLDDKTIVFGQRFNMVQFETKKMAEQGWIIRK